MMIRQAQLQQNFSRAASHYDLHARLQQQWRQELFARALAHAAPHPVTLVDVGSGPGAFAQAWRAQRPQDHVLNLDIAYGMCVQAHTHAPSVQASACALPLRDASVDLLVSSLCLQWVEDLPKAMAEMARVLRPGGAAMLMTLGAQTLQELRAMDGALRLLPMRDVAAYSEAAAHAKLLLHTSEQRLQAVPYADLSALLHSMRAIGAGAAFDAPALRLSPGRYKALAQAYAQQHPHAGGGVVASWQPLYMHLVKE
jgi:malonyl-CoA O-methyltransferase